MIYVNNGTSPSGKAPGFGPGISEVRILPSQLFAFGFCFFAFSLRLVFMCFTLIGYAKGFMVRSRLTKKNHTAHIYSLSTQKVFSIARLMF